MSSKKRQDQYTAGLVSKPFWFYEYKAYVNELLNGSSADEIRSSAFEKHLFSAAKEYRVKEILNCVSRRVTQFDQDWQELFGQQSVMVQRMMVLLSIMADDKLFFTFMYRVYRDKLIVGAESLESSDVLAFFRLMQNESEESGEKREFKRTKAVVDQFFRNVEHFCKDYIKKDFKAQLNCLILQDSKGKQVVFDISEVYGGFVQKRIEEFVRGN